MADMERLTTTLDPTVSRRLRMLAVATRRPLYELVNEALTAFLNAEEAGADDRTPLVPGDAS